MHDAQWTKHVKARILVEGPGSRLYILCFRWDGAKSSYRNLNHEGGDWNYIAFENCPLFPVSLSSMIQCLSQYGPPSGRRYRSSVVVRSTFSRTNPDARETRIASLQLAFEAEGWFVPRQGWYMTMFMAHCLSAEIAVLRTYSLLL
jgi:hypothetical protein